MLTDTRVEMALPFRISTGDVIEDPIAGRWVTVDDICVLSGVGAGIYGFYNRGLDERLTFGGRELVKRRTY